MTDLQAIGWTAAFGVAVAIAAWIIAHKALGRRRASRWRAAVVALPIVVACVLYAVFWIAFFSSPTLAVQTHAIRLTLVHFVGPYLPWLGVAWGVAALWALSPLLRRT